MKVMYNRTGAERKALVLAISQVLGVRQRYQGMPTCSFMIGIYEIDKDGTLIAPSDCDAEAFERLLGQLSMKGFEYAAREDDPVIEPQSEPEMEAGEALESSALSLADAPTEHTEQGLRIPLDGMTDAQFLNLERLIMGKASLIRKALDADDLLIMKENNQLLFPWFTRQLSDKESTTYTHFLAALMQQAKHLKRTSGVERPVDSEKCRFRIFLLRLGYGGPEHAEERRMLLQNLSGSSAFPNQAKRDEHTARWKQKREQQRAAQLSNQMEVCAK